MDRKNEALEKQAMTKPYNDYNSYLRKRHGQKVYKIGLDAGFSCPNRDGTIGKGGCIYCDDRGSRSSYTDPAMSVARQLSSRIEYLQNKFGAEKFIAYFQAFTNTHAPVEKLRSIYDNILGFESIVGLSIGTRPDCIDDEKADLVASYAGRYETWIEYGLQSIYNNTLKFLKRGHTFEDFTHALKLSKSRGIKACAHIILGLPGESMEDAVKTARTLSDLKVDGAKIHLLHILKSSPLEKLYLDGKLKMPSQKEYVDTVCAFLENLAPGVIIQRLTGEGGKNTHVAPLWALDKTGTIKMIETELVKRGTRQGFFTNDKRKKRVPIKS